MKTLQPIENLYPFEVGQKVRYKAMLGSTLKEAYIVRFIDEDTALCKSRKGRIFKSKLENLHACASVNPNDQYEPLYLPWSKHLLQKIRIAKIDPFLCEAIWTYVAHKCWARKLVMPTITVTDLPGPLKGYYKVKDGKPGQGEILIDRGGNFGLNGLASVVAHESCHQYEDRLGHDPGHEDLFHKLARHVGQKTGIKVVARSTDESDAEFQMGLGKLESKETFFYIFVHDQEERKIDCGHTKSKLVALDAFNAFSGDFFDQVTVYAMKDLALRKLCADLDEQRKKGGKKYSLTEARDFMLDYAKKNGKVVLDHKPKRD